MTAWIRIMQGRPAVPDERERWLTGLRAQRRAQQREYAAQYAAQYRRRVLAPREREALIERGRREDADPYTRQLRIEAQQLRARRRAAAELRAARARAEQAAEARARDILLARYGSAQPAPARDAGRGRDITRSRASRAPVGYGVLLALGPGESSPDGCRPCDRCDYVICRCS